MPIDTSCDVMHVATDKATMSGLAVAMAACGFSVVEGVRRAPPGLTAYAAVRPKNGSRAPAPASVLMGHTGDARSEQVAQLSVEARATSLALVAVEFVRWAR